MSKTHWTYVGLHAWCILKLVGGHVRNLSIDMILLSAANLISALSVFAVDMARKQHLAFLLPDLAITNSVVCRRSRPTPGCTNRPKLFRISLTHFEAHTVCVCPRKVSSQTLCYNDRKLVPDEMK